MFQFYFWLYKMIPMNSWSRKVTACIERHCIQSTLLLNISGDCSVHHSTGLMPPMFSFSFKNFHSWGWYSSCCHNSSLHSGLSEVSHAATWCTSTRLESFSSSGSEYCSFSRRAILNLRIQKFVFYLLWLLYGHTAQ